MPSWHAPTQAEVASAVALLAQPQHFRRFFERLENPLWLAPLREKGFFSTPQQPIVDLVSGTTRHPDWPVLTYLSRVIHDPSTHAEIVSLLAAMPDTDNEKVREDLIRLALLCPAQAIRRVIPHARAWARGPFNFGVHRAIADLAQHAAALGAPDLALELAGTLLDLLPDAGAPAGRVILTPRARFSAWEYGEILDILSPRLVVVLELNWVRLLADLLARALHLSHANPSASLSDHSHIWFPDLDHAPRGQPDIKEILVRALRDAADSLMKTRPETAPVLIDAWIARNRLLFVRFALRAAARFPHTSLSEKLLLQEGLVATSETSLEFARLLHLQFAAISPQAQTRLLDQIAQGPIASTIDDSPLESSWRARWIRDYLGLVREHLSAGYTAALVDLESRLGPAQVPGPAVGPIEDVWTGPESPMTAEQLGKLSVRELRDFLQAWVPTRDWMGPTASGLGAQMMHAAESRPDQFSREAELLIGVQHTYARSVLDGLSAVVKNGGSIAWDPVLRLCGWIVSQPRSPEDKLESDWDCDPHWGWARKSVISLLDAGIRRRVIPEGCAGVTWDLVDAVLGDPDPDTEGERRSMEGGMDPVTMSLNTVRSAAVQAVVTFGLWRKEVLKLGDMRDIAHVRRALDEHLAPNQDPSLAVRSVYGQKLPWLFLLDQDWMQSRLEDLLPSDPTLALQRDGAWDSYLATCELYDAMWPMLLKQYASHVARLGTEPRDARVRPRDPDERLAEHLMIAYARSHCDLGRDGLMSNFLVRAPGSLTRHALSFVGWSLRKSTKVQDGILERLTALWDFASEYAGNPSAVLGSIGAWVGSGKFSAEWLMPRLVRALAATRGEVDADRDVIAFLAENASASAPDVLACLEAMLSGQEGSWRLQGWRTQVRTILRTTLDLPQTAETARRLVGWLGQRGATDLADLV